MTTEAKARATESAPAGGAPAARSSSFFATHDLAVVVVALVAICGAHLAYASMTKQDFATFNQQGLSFKYPADWMGSIGPDWQNLPAEQMFWSLPTVGGETKSTKAFVGLSVRIEEKFLLGNEGDIGIHSYLQRQRKKLYDPFYSEKPTVKGTVSGRTWMRTEYVHATNRSGNPSVVVAVEYATLNNDKLYIVTLHGTEARVRELEDAVLGSVIVK